MSSWIRRSEHRAAPAALMLRGFARLASGSRVPLTRHSTHARLALTGRALSSNVGSSAAGFETPTGAREPFGSRFSTRSAKQQRSSAGVLTIKNTWNNTIINIADLEYKTKAVVSAGTAGFKKSKRSSFFATDKVISDAFEKARELGLRKIMINMTGPAVVLRKPLLKQLREQTKLRIMKLRMSDSVPHGGCRPRKSRRRRYKTRARR